MLTVKTILVILGTPMYLAFTVTVQNIFGTGHHDFLTLSDYLTLLVIMEYQLHSQRAHNEEHCDDKSGPKTPRDKGQQRESIYISQIYRALMVQNQVAELAKQ